ncbi:MAG: 50S ribosomal protein L29 [Pseudomonadota bacterium]|nr:50S ribosomal protein L29 [Pseudomonadota bacterium]
MKASEMHSKSQVELEQELNDLLKEQFTLRMQQGAGQLARPDQVKKVRKNIARVKTVMNQKMAGSAS